MAVEINSKKPEAQVGWYVTETAEGLDYLQAKGSTKYGNPVGDALLAQGYKFVGSEDPRTVEVEEEAEEVKEEPKKPAKTSKAKK